MTKRLTVLFASVLVFWLLPVAGQDKSVSDDRTVQEEFNKKMVMEFYQDLFGNKNPEAVKKYIAEGYIQHNPTLPDGREALYEGVKVWFKDSKPETVDFQRVAADGDLVWLHIRSRSGAKVRAIVDIFRIENGKIVEHWDVIQEVPEKSANDHPMF